MSPCVVEQSRINVINVSHPIPTSVKLCVTSQFIWNPIVKKNQFFYFKTNFQRWNSFQVQHIFHPSAKFAKEQSFMLACQRLSSNINSGGRPHNLGSLWCGQQSIFLVQIFTQMWKTLWGTILTKAFFF